MITITVSRASTAQDQRRLHVMSAVAKAIINDRVAPDTRRRAPTFVPCSPSDVHNLPLMQIATTPAGKGSTGTLRKGSARPTASLLGARGLPVHQAGYPGHLLDNVMAARLLALQEADEDLTEDQRAEVGKKLAKLAKQAEDAVDGDRASRGLLHTYSVRIPKLEIIADDLAITLPKTDLELDLSDHRPGYHYGRATLRNVRGAWLRTTGERGPGDRTERTSKLQRPQDPLAAAYCQLLGATQAPVNWLGSRERYQRNPACPKREAAAWEVLTDHVMQLIDVDQERPFIPSTVPAPLQYA